MLRYPDIDPVAITIGPVAVHWYGLMYLLGFGLAWWLGHLRARRPDSGWSPNQVADLVFYGAVGAIVGGRLGYLLFYKPGAWLADPVMAVRLWEGGMSFHGGLIGAIVALWLLARAQQRPFTAVTDFAAPLIPLGLCAGRIGNFINGELWGRPTELPWGMVFPHVDDLARHPSQLYQAGIEGVALFALLWWFTARPRPRMAASALFLLGYGVARFSVEFARAPDPGIGFVAFNWMTMGQVLSLPMALAGVVLLAWAYRDASRPPAAAP